MGYSVSVVLSPPSIRFRRSRLERSVPDESRHHLFGLGGRDWSAAFLMGLATIYSVLAVETGRQRSCLAPLSRTAPPQACPLSAWCCADRSGCTLMVPYNVTRRVSSATTQQWLAPLNPPAVCIVP